MCQWDCDQARVPVKITVITTVTKFTCVMSLQLCQGSHRLTEIPSMTEITSVT